MTFAAAAELNDVDLAQWVYLGLVSVVYLAAAVDFFRFSSVIHPIVERYRFAILGGLILFPALGAVLGAAADLIAEANGSTALRMGMAGGIQFLAGIVFFMAGCIWVRRCPLRGTVRQDLIWKRRLGGRTEYVQSSSQFIRLGAAIALGLFFTAGSFLLIAGYNKFIDPQAVPRLETDGPVVQVIFFALLAPLYEEIIYRWYLLHALMRLFQRKAFGRILAIMLSSAIWALDHTHFDPPGLKMTQIFIIGCFLGGLFPRLGLEGCIVAHLTLNLIILTIFI